MSEEGAPIAAPAVAVAAPAAQSMNDASAILAPHKGILVKQKMDIMDLIIPCQKENKYKVASKPKDKGNEPSEWEDKTFKKALKKNEILTMKEKSDFMARFCCMARREFNMKVKAGDDVDAEGGMGSFFRPFKCTMLCGPIMLNPQKIEVKDKSGEFIGEVVQHFDCIKYCMCTNMWKVKDKDDKTRYIIEQNLCSTNACAPSPCCAVHNIDIKDADGKEVVGNIRDYFPGCNFKGLSGAADNFMVNFPDDATPKDKFLLLGATVLIDYMIFEKQPGEDGVAID